jgi:PAS domain S-box-containing protein/putative nucleotidyltransferase with HDIG domain
MTNGASYGALSGTTGEGSRTDASNICSAIGEKITSPSSPYSDFLSCSSHGRHTTLLKIISGRFAVQSPVTVLRENRYYSHMKRETADKTTRSSAASLALPIVLLIAGLAVSIIGALAVRADIIGDFSANPAFANLAASGVGPNYTMAWVVLGGGVVISFLMCFLFWSLLGVQSRSRKLAEELTADIRNKQQALIDSEYRWKFALEGTGDGLWDWDVPNSRVFYSHSFKEMLGYADDEISDALTEWSSRVHPDDIDATMRAVQEHLEGRNEHYSSEHRVRCKDGHYIWILDRGMVVARDKDGKPLRMLGTHKDISDRKDIEEALLRNRNELIEAQRMAKMSSWILHTGTNQLEWSTELAKMLDRAPDEKPPVLDALRPMFTQENWTILMNAIANARTNGTPYDLIIEYNREDGRKAFMHTRGEAYRAPDGSIPWLRGVASDVTESVLAERRIQLLNRLYLSLSACNDAIVHCRDQHTLLARICEVVVSHGNMAMAWIGLLDEATGNIVPRYWAGNGADYLSDIQISVRADVPGGRGPTGTATRENHPVWIDDFRTNAMTHAWQQRAARFGWFSSAALPLCRGGQPIGALTFYSAEPGWFTAEIRGLLEEMALNIGFALDKLQVEEDVRRSHATLQESEQRFHSLVEQSLVGAFIAQKQRFVYVNPYMEVLLGYLHDGSLLHVTPAHVVSERDRPDMQSKLDALNAGTIANFEHAFTALRRDGSTLEVGVTISSATYQQEPAIIGLIQDVSNRKVAEAQIKRYAGNLEKVFMQTVSMITNLVEMRDPYTVGHETRVAELAVALGREMGLDEAQLEGLRIGGYLHDVGKVSVPAEILSKPGRINAIEYELIKGHPAAGYQILKDVEFPWPVAEIAHQHHERINGSGYPRGLKGKEILLEARIVAVADVVESMHSHRPYRPGLGIDKALDEVQRGSGTLYDSEVVNACLRLFNERGYQMPQ